MFGGGEMGDHSLQKYKRLRSVGSQNERAEGPDVIGESAGPKSLRNLTKSS